MKESKVLLTVLQRLRSLSSCATRFPEVIFWCYLGDGAVFSSADWCVGTVHIEIGVRMDQYSLRLVPSGREYYGWQLRTGPPRPGR